MIRFSRILLLAGMATLLAGCAVVQAAETAPPIDGAALQAQFAPGSSSITVRVPNGVVAYCAPDVAYTRWYLAHYSGDVRLSNYDSRMKPYTRQAARPLGAGVLTCRKLADGNYVVWAFMSAPNASGPGSCAPAAQKATESAEMPGYGLGAVPNDCNTTDPLAHVIPAGQQGVVLSGSSTTVDF